MCLEGNNQYNYIYFGGDITLSSGITISSTKTNVIIDGTHNGTKHTYTDMKSAGSGDTIILFAIIFDIIVSFNRTG